MSITSLLRYFSLLYFYYELDPLRCLIWTRWDSPNLDRLLLQCMVHIGTIQFSPKLERDRIRTLFHYSLSLLMECLFFFLISYWSVIYVGEKDFGLTNGIELLDSFVDPVVINHPQGHVVPKLGNQYCWKNPLISSSIKYFFYSKINCLFVKNYDFGMEGVSYFSSLQIFNTIWIFGFFANRYMEGVWFFKPPLKLL